MASSSVAIVTMPTLPAWWPPSGYEEITEAQVGELFRYLKTVMPPVMADARCRIQDRVGDDPIRVWPTTVKNLAGRRLGYFDALNVVHLSARDRDETVSVAIGLRPDGKLAILGGTPERRQQEWVVWEG
jgi:hypothetical protein